MSPNNNPAKAPSPAKILSHEIEAGDEIVRQEEAGVVSSILTPGTSGSSSGVERFLAKEEVGGANPLSRSRIHRS